MDPTTDAYVKKYGPYVAVGLVVLYFLYTYMSGSSTSSTATTASGLTSAQLASNTALAAQQLSNQGAAQLATIQANGQIALAQVQGSTTATLEGTLAAAQAYQTNINATATVANTAIAQTAQQNETGYNALSTGFTNYVVGASNIAATEAAATSNIAVSNNNTGLQVAQDIQSIANLVSAAYGEGSGFGGAGAQSYYSMGGLQTIPVVVGVGNTANGQTAGNGSIVYGPNGNWTLVPPTGQGSSGTSGAVAQVT